MTAPTSATTPAPRPSRAISGMPRVRRTGVWVATRAGLLDREVGRVGAGRPLDGGRGRTWLGRDPRRSVIGADCRTPDYRTPWVQTCRSRNALRSPGPGPLTGRCGCRLPDDALGGGALYS